MKFAEQFIYTLEKLCVCICGGGEYITGLEVNLDCHSSGAVHHVFETGPLSL